MFNQLRVLAEEGAVRRGFPRSVGGLDEHGGNVAGFGFQELVIAKPSVQIKAGVQWGLFGSAVNHLGTAEHHPKWLPGIMSLEIPGCFAMTETGHGSDVAGIATTVNYDPGAGEFVLHTPFRGAWKDYIGNAADDGLAAVVFAQLVTRGLNHGVQAFYVLLRRPAQSADPGFPARHRRRGRRHQGRAERRGQRSAALHSVRIPRTNLLNRYGDVPPDGTYSSPIAGPGRRFFTMLGGLVQGRVSLDGAAVTAPKLALKTAIQYATERRQFSSSPRTDEEVLLDYQRHQRRLFTRLAATYAASFASEQLLQKFDDFFSGKCDTDQDRQDLETLAAALKPLSTWHALDTLQECREACGGAGFLIENRFASLRADLDVYATFEGDNTVLLQPLGNAGDPGTRVVLTWLRDLFGLSLVEKNLSWYLTNGRLSMQRGRTVGRYIDRLLARIRPHALDLVDAFGYGPEHLGAEIATGAERIRQEEARAYLRALRAGGQGPEDEKNVLARRGSGVSRP